MSDDTAYTRTYFGDRPVEVVQGSDGATVAEIVKSEDVFQVWRKSPATFPPTRRHTLLASFPTLDEARANAPSLLAPDPEQA